MNTIIKEKQVLIEILFFGLLLVLTYFSNSFFPKNIEEQIGFSEFLFLTPTLIFAGVSLLLCYFFLKEEHLQANYLDYLKRLRIKKIKGKNLLKAIILCVAALILQGLLILILENLLDYKIFNDTTVKSSEYLIKSKLLIYLLPLALIINAIVEELLWRGYLLPIQERNWGKFAWIINGFMWGFCHIFSSNPLNLLLFFFAISYIGQKYKSSTITIIIHVLYNSLLASHWFVTYL